MKKLKLMILQYGTNNILKNDKIADGIFQNFEQLTDRYMDNIEPENFVLCEVPQFKYKLENCLKEKQAH